MKNGANLSLPAVCTIAQVEPDVLLGVWTVDVEVEVLLLDFFVLAVGTDRVDGGIDTICVGLVALAHGNADAITEVLDVGERWPDEGEAFAGVGFQETILEQGGIGTVPSRRPAATSR